MTRGRTGRLLLQAGLLCLWAAVAHGWDQRPICPFSGRDCVRAGPVMTSHGSACADFGVLRVFDLTRHRHLSLPGKAERWQVANDKGNVVSDEGFHWQSDAAIVVERSEWTMQSCNEPGEGRDRRLVRVALPK